MKKRILAMILICFLLSGMDVHVSYASHEDGLRIGDYVNFGMYQNHVIQWRVIGDSEQDDVKAGDLVKGNPLLFSVKILDFKAFDIDISYGDNPCPPSAEFWTGRNDWETSTIRRWLMSCENEGKVSYVPQKGWDIPGGNISNGNNRPVSIYAKEKGFLANDNFTAAERELIQPVTQKSILDSPYWSRKTGGIQPGEFDNRREIGSNASNPSRTIEDTIELYQNAYYHTIQDTVFLLDVEQLNTFYKAFEGVGLEGKMTLQAWEFRKNMDLERSYDYWLRTPAIYLKNYSSAFFEPGIDTLKVSPEKQKEDKRIKADVSGGNGNTYCGIRPAMYLKGDSLAFHDGNGTYESPYVITKELTGEERVKRVYKAITEQIIKGKNKNLQNITSDLYLPYKIPGDAGCTIRWSGGDERNSVTGKYKRYITEPDSNERLPYDYVYSNTFEGIYAVGGKVTRPENGKKDFKGKLEATINYYDDTGSYSLTKTFPITVKAMPLKIPDKIKHNRKRKKLTLKWAKSQGASKYRIYYKHKAKKYKSVYSKKATYTFKNLKKGTYRFKVKSMSKYQTSAASKVYKTVIK